MSIAIGVAASVLYVAATALLALRLVSVDYVPALSRRGFAGATVGAVSLHAVLLYQGIVTAGGLNLGFFNAASLIAWAVALLLVTTMVARPIENLGIIVLPVAAATVVLALIYPGGVATGRSPGFGVQTHIVVSIVAYSLLAIGACQAVLLYVQDHLLRAKRPGLLLRLLPPLQVQEAILVQLLGVGFFFLSLSLLSGIMFVENVLAQHLAHKTVLSGCAWLVFGVLLWGRWKYGWRGRVLTRFTLGGFAFLMLAYFGSKLVLEVVLGRTWYGS